MMPAAAQILTAPGPGHSGCPEPCPAPQGKPSLRRRSQAAGSQEILTLFIPNTPRKVRHRRKTKARGEKAALETARNSIWGTYSGI